MLYRRDAVRRACWTKPHQPYFSVYLLDRFTFTSEYSTLLLTVVLR